MRTLLLALLLLPLMTNAQGLPPDPLRSNLDSTLVPFYHGVASGDPEADRVMIWTRITTDQPLVDVEWRVALDTAMSDVVASGTATTDADKDYTVKVDVSGLQPFTYYFYEFESEGQRSVRGRTRTLPVGTGVDSLRFAVVSCSNYSHGYFNAYERITARNDIFAVIHLGDYIYEYGDGEYGNERPLEPDVEIITLNDYRMRHSQYKLDADLMRLHQQYPFFTVWDDHETANNSWVGGAGNHDASEGDWFQRKSAGIRAYAEWMPLRLPDPQDTARIYRRFEFGDLLTLHMLDTRLIGRDEQDGTSNTAPERTLLGTQQYDWLTSGMSASPARWQVLGQQVMVAPLAAFGVPVNDDQWDGYPAERQRIYDHVIDNLVRNMVVLTGDIHTSWGNDLPNDGYNGTTGANSAGVEFVTTSVTSTSIDLPLPAALIQVLNPHIKYVDLTRKGYLIFDVNQQRVQGDWYYVDRVDAPSTVEAFGTARQSLDMSRRLTTAGGASVAGSSMVGVQAPLPPRTDLSVGIATPAKDVLLVGAYPNPFLDHVDIQYFARGGAEVMAELYDVAGNLLLQSSLGKPAAGVQIHRMDVPGLGSGSYVLRLTSGGNTMATRLIKVD
jgi:alkaline phosphatase D